ncbi:hypothetical protein BH24PSE2_BH24PSE2_01720 [soil metagenome]
MSPEAVGLILDEACLARDFDDSAERMCRGIINVLTNSTNKRYQERKFQLILADGLGYLQEVSKSDTERQEARLRQTELFQKLLARFPGDVDILLNFAFSFEGEEPAIPILRQAVEADPTNVTAQWILALHLMNSGNLESQKSSITHFRAAYENAVGNEKLHMASETYLALKHGGFTEEAMAFRSTVKNAYHITEAIDKAELAVRSADSVSEMLSEIRHLADIGCHFQYMLIEHSTCNFVLEWLRKIEQREPRNAAVLELMISTYEALADLPSTADGLYATEVRNKYETLFELVPGNDQLLYRYALHLEGGKRLAVLEKLVGDNHDVSADVRASLAESLVQANRRSEAIEQLRQAFDDPSAEYRRVYGERLAQLLRLEGHDGAATEVEQTLEKL